MSRHTVFALCLVASSIGGALAQERLTTTRVATQPNGIRFFVDGQQYRSTQAFIWPAGSKHTLSVDTVQYPFEGNRYTFSGWSDTAGKLKTSTDTMVFTADPSISGMTASFSAEFRLQVLFYQCDQTRPETCRPPGTVDVNGMTSSTDVDTWYTSDTTVTLFASPSSGFVFAGWGPQGGYSTSPVLSVNLKGPMTFSNIFAAAKRVTLNTDPDGLLVAPDGTPTRAPAQMDWGENTRHTLGVVSPQTNKDNTSLGYVFYGWSNGAKANDVYLAKDANIPDTLTAKFVRAVNASFITDPLGLKIKVEGRDNWPVYNFVWGVGLKYQVSAPAEQTDSRGRRYVFKSWSNGGPATQDITVLEENVQTGLRLTAVYEPLTRLTIETSPLGMPVLIDGKECRANCAVDKPAGTRVEIAAVDSVPLTETNRLDFAGWSDGGPATRTVVIGSEGQVRLVASYRNMYRLMASAEPGQGANFRLDPVSSDGYYGVDSNVSVTADPKNGYRFRRWDGDLTGTFRTGSVLMSAPRVVKAYLDAVPWTDDSGVRNAAADDAADAVVAPGSIAVVHGVNLAASSETGPGNPLAQTLAGVVVRWNERLLPLVSASPDQVLFQVPSDLPEGQHYVYVRSGNNPELRAQLTVSRNAPGLYRQKVDKLDYAWARHEDGSEITADSPAKAGELVTLLGTGFGPYDKTAIDGFAVPAGLPYNLADSLQVYSGDRLLELQWAGALAGKVGMAIARFRLPQDLSAPDGAPDGAIAVRVRINGRDSNSVLLRVQ